MKRRQFHYCNCISNVNKIAKKRKCSPKRTTRSTISAPKRTTRSTKSAPKRTTRSTKSACNESHCVVVVTFIVLILLNILIKDDLEDSDSPASADEALSPGIFFY